MRPARFAVAALVVGGFIVFDEPGPGLEDEWRVYDYNGGTGEENVWYPVDVTDGVVSADDSRWRIDTPESPDSILAFVHYREWVNAGSVDLRDGSVTFRLRGDLDLAGAHATFWILSQDNGQRWHLDQPLTVTDEWTTFALRLPADQDAWHRSWTRQPSNLPLVDDLGDVDSWGIAFVGFDREVTGTLMMADFEVSPR